MTEQKTKAESPVIDYKKVRECLPHRYPFLFIDKAISLDLEKKKIVCVKNVTTNEPFFQGHFPDDPIMPGVLIVEALAQAGGVLVYELGTRGLFVLSSVKGAKFRRLVRPGDVLHLEVEAVHVTKRGGRMLGVAKVEGELAAEAEILFAFLSA